MSLKSRPALGVLVATALAASLLPLVQPTATALPSLPSAQHAPPPQHDAFYRPPAPLPDVAPGTILRSRPVEVSQYGLGVQVDAWQILYRSTSATQRPNAVSGTVLVPEQDWTDGPRPLVSYAVGTHGLGPECAPSYRMTRGEEQEFGLFRQALSRGWAVVVTDYEGLGTPGPHTYVAGRALGHAMLDAARAAQLLPAADLSPEGPVGLWGYSEGGLATGWAAELAARYAPELRIAGAAVGAAPADVGAMARLHDGGPASGLVLAGAVGLATAYPDVPFDEILTERGRQAVAEISTMCTEEMSARFAFQRLDGYTTVQDPMSLPEWREVLDDIRLGKVAPEPPVMIYHSPADELVTFDQALRLYGDWCDGGAAVLLQPLVPGEHIVGAVAGAPVAVQYLNGQFSGTPARASCPNQAGNERDTP